MLSQLEAIRFDDVIGGLKCPVEELGDEQLQKLCEIKSEIEQRQKNFAILYYQPQDHQKPFHESKKKLRLISGSNQSGKTISSTNEGIQISLGIHPTKKIPVPNKGRVIATDLGKGIGEVIQE